MEQGGTAAGARLVFGRVIIPVLTHWSVPVFFMISGSLLLDPDKKVGLDRIKKYMLRMAAIICSFAAGYCLIESLFVMYADGPAAVLKSAAYNWVSGHSWDHMWYVYALLGLYVFTPVLRAFTGSADRRTAVFVLVFLYIFTAFRPTINSVIGIEIVQILPVTSINLFYFLLGHYLSKWELERSKVLAMLAVGASGFAVVQAFTINGHEMNETAFVALYSAALFMLCKNAHILASLAEYRWMQTLSAASFGIYLLHPIFIHVLYRLLKIFPDILPMAIGEAVILAVVVACSYATTVLLKKIKPLRAIL